MDTKTTDYISRRDLLARYDANHTGAPGRAREFIEQAPAADVAPVAHSYWIVNGGNPSQGTCGNCGGKGNWRNPYCPNCGAKMDKEDT